MRSFIHPRHLAHIWLDYRCPAYHLRRRPSAIQETRRSDLQPNPRLQPWPYLRITYLPCSPAFWAFQLSVEATKGQSCQIVLESESWKCAKASTCWGECLTLPSSYSVMCQISYVSVTFLGRIKDCCHCTQLLRSADTAKLSAPSSGTTTYSLIKCSPCRTFPAWSSCSTAYTSFARKTPTSHEKWIRLHSSDTPACLLAVATTELSRFPWKNDVFKRFKQHSMKNGGSNEEQDVCLVNLQDDTLSDTTMGDENLLFTAPKTANQRSFFSSLHAQSIYHFCKKSFLHCTTFTTLFCVSKR